MKHEVPLITLIGSWWGVFFASLMAIATGMLMGASELMLAPVRVVSVPTAAVGSEVVFLRGSSLGGNWPEKLQIYLAQGPRALDFTEGELNRFAKKAFEEGSQPTIKGATMEPNIKITGSQMQLALIVKMEGLATPIVFQSKGGFAKSAEGFVFVPQTTYFGTLPLPDGAAGWLVNAFFAKVFGGPDAGAFRAAWTSLDSAAVQGEYLSLRWR